MTSRSEIQDRNRDEAVKSLLEAFDDNADCWQQ
jgi:hypothetical protein